MLFTGEFEHIIDTKGRLAIPSEIRTQLKKEDAGHAFYLTIGANRALRLYEVRAFETLSNRIEQGLVTDESVREFEELLFPLSRRLEVDSAGRVRLPDRHIERAGLTKEKPVMLIGVRDHLQIRDVNEWNDEIENRLSRQADIFERYVRRVQRDDGTQPEK